MTDAASLDIRPGRVRAFFQTVQQIVLARIPKYGISFASIAEGSPRVSTEAKVRKRLDEQELPVAEKKRMLAMCEQLGFRSPEDLKAIEESTKLRHFFGGQFVATLRTPDGVVVVGAAAPPGESLLSCIASSSDLTDEQKSKVSINFVPRGRGNGIQSAFSEIATPFVGADR